MDQVLEPIPLDPPGHRVSYAQNGEDVRLWRAFDAIERGFYVEVGGCDPERDSISRSFYGRGWSGLVIEPVADLAAQYRARRPRDVVVEALAGSKQGEALLYVFDGTGLSTTVREHAARHARDGYSYSERLLPVVTMDSVTADLPSLDIHFLVIDVEGAEADVLGGLNLSTVRPWVLIIESTLPRTSEDSSATWEPSVLDAGYRFTAFDGVSRFYVAQEHMDLAAALADPPSVLDGFVSWREDMLQRDRTALSHRRDELEGQLAVLSSEHAATSQRLGAVERQLGETRQRLVASEAQAERLRSELDAVLASRSWRVTKPLRALRRRGA